MEVFSWENAGMEAFAYLAEASPEDATPDDLVRLAIDAQNAVCIAGIYSSTVGDCVRELIANNRAQRIRDIVGVQWMTAICQHNMIYAAQHRVDPIIEDGGVARRVADLPCAADIVDGVV